LLAKELILEAFEETLGMIEDRGTNGNVEEQYRDFDIPRRLTRRSPIQTKPQEKRKTPSKQMEELNDLYSASKGERLRPRANFDRRTTTKNNKGNNYE
jgi:hypothetical protein